MIDIYHVQIIQVVYGAEKKGEYWQMREKLCSLVEKALRKRFYVPDDYPYFVFHSTAGLGINGYFRIPSSRLNLANLWLYGLVNDACKATNFTMDGTRFEIFDDGFEMRNEV